MLSTGPGCHVTLPGHHNSHSARHTTCTRHFRDMRPVCGLSMAPTMLLGWASNQSKGQTPDHTATPTCNKHSHRTMLAVVRRPAQNNGHDDPLHYSKLHAWLATTRNHQMKATRDSSTSVIQPGLCSETTASSKEHRPVLRLDCNKYCVGLHTVQGSSQGVCLTRLISLGCKEALTRVKATKHAATAKRYWQACDTTAAVPEPARTAQVVPHTWLVQKAQLPVAWPYPSPGHDNNKCTCRTSQPLQTHQNQVPSNNRRSSDCCWLMPLDINIAWCRQSSRNGVRVCRAWTRRSMFQSVMVLAGSCFGC
jgi:hypothetical protein